jgi:hypothetical protein
VTPAATAPTPAPTPGPIYKGRACTVGTVINDFLIVHEPPPGPAATCIEQVAPSTPERLYRLRTVPDGLEFFLLERDDRGHTVTVYRSIGNPEGAAVEIIVTEGQRDPEPIILAVPSSASAADFLPVPGIAIRYLTSLTAAWHEGGRSYMLIIDGAKTTLTLEEAAALLEAFTPGPPNTGNTANSASRDSTPWGLVPRAGAVVVVLGAAAIFSRRLAGNS